MGRYAFDPANSPLVVLAGGADGSLSADAVRFVGAGAAPPAEISYVHSDHLGTPQKLSDQSGALVWDRIQTPFGLDHAVTGPGGTPVRFPGQYADGESGLAYNYFRDYDPSLGRYVQSDPIGLNGGLNTFVYVRNNALSRVDMYGLIEGGPPPVFDPNNPPKPPKTTPIVGQPEPLPKRPVKASCGAFLMACIQRCKDNRIVKACKRLPGSLGRAFSASAITGCASGCIAAYVICVAAE